MRPDNSNAAAEVLANAGYEVARALMSDSGRVQHGDKSLQVFGEISAAHIRESLGVKKCSVASQWQ
jgi:hypothetical protein